MAYHPCYVLLLVTYQLIWLPPSSNASHLKKCGDTFKMEDYFGRQHCSEEYYILSTVCRNCKHNGTEENISVCETEVHSTNLSLLATSLGENTAILVIVFEDKNFIGEGRHWRRNNYKLSIDLSDFNVMTNLRHLYLTGKSSKTAVTYDVTFVKLNSTVSRIPPNLSLWNMFGTSQEVGNFTSWLPDLHLLDLSYNLDIGLNSWKYALRGDHSKTKYLCLCQIQTIQSKHYLGDASALFFDELNHTVYASLLELDLSHNDITVLPLGLSSSFPNLLLLDISGNYLFHSTLSILNTIDILNMNHLEKISFGHQLSSLEKETKIDLNFKHIPLQKYVPLLIERESDVKFILNCINTYTEGNISNIIFDKKKQCNLIGCIFHSDLLRNMCRAGFILQNTSKIWNPNCWGSIEFPIGKNLDYLELSRNALFIWLHINVNRKLCFAKNKLKELLILAETSSNPAKTLDLFGNFGDMFGLWNLSEITLIGTSRVSFHKLSTSCPNLLSLKLCNAHLDNTDKPTSICKLFPKLISLTLNNMSLDYLNISLILKNCSKLKVLDLSNNHLNDNNIVSALHIPNTLKKLILANNSISTLGKQLMSQISKSRDILVDITGNELTCNCTQESQEFMMKLSTFGHTKFINFKKYFCQGKFGRIYLTDIDQTTFWTHCQENIEKEGTYSLQTLLMLSILPFSMIFLILLGTLLLNHRFKFRLFLFRVKMRLQSLSNCLAKKKPNRYKYDAFVSYSSEDRYWVHNILMPKLENEYGFRLCVHYRDFPLGQCVIDTIFHSIESSREMIVVLSNKAIKSNWCQFELDASLKEVMSRGNTLTVIILGDISAHLLNPVVADLFQNHICLQWSQSKKHQNIFWIALRNSLFSETSNFTWNCCHRKPEVICDMYFEIKEESADEQEETIRQNIDPDVPESAIENWVSAEKSRMQHDRAKQTRQSLLFAISQNEIPDWAYGPTPSNIRDMLRDFSKKFDDQATKYAKERVQLTIDCLAEYEDRKAKNYVLEMRKVEEIQQGKGGDESDSDTQSYNDTLLSAYINK